MTNITEMLNMIAQDEHEHYYSVVINTKVSDQDQIIEGIGEALSQAELYEEDGDFTDVDVLVCASLIQEFSALDPSFDGNVCFWFDRPAK